MKNKKMIKNLCALSLLSLCSASHAYVIYNKLDTSVTISDHAGRGIHMTIPAQGSVACAPYSEGCYGRKDFSVYATNSTRNGYMCSWYGIIPKERGNYFVITKGPLEDPGYRCVMEYYHD